MTLEHRVFHLEAEVARLKRLLFYSMQKSGTAAVSLPSVDFIVDQFDRKNADNLGPYWGNPTAANSSRFGIRTKRAVPFNPWSLSRRILSLLFQNYQGPPNPRSEIFNGVATSGPQELAFGPRLYQARITSEDIRAKVTFDGPQYSFESGEGVERIIIAPAATAGIVLSNETNQLAGGVLQAFSSPGTSVPPATDAMRLMIAEFGDFGAVRNTLWNEFLTVGIYTFDNMRSAPVNPSSNTIELSLINGLFTFTLNGTSLYSASPQLLSSPSRVGLGSYLYNSVSDAIARSLPFWGITSFKAWRSDIPEPPSESGHGLYRKDAGVKNQFVDVYHTPIKNTTTGELTGYTYNPEA